MKLKTVAATFALAVSCTAPTAFPEQPKNVIIILTDNQSPGLLAAYGNPDIRTPHIDALARSGVTFMSAHASSGVCSPSRATLLTGLLPSQTGVHNALPSQPGLENWSAIAEFQNLPGQLSFEGYTTALIGKYHLGRHDQAQLGFDTWVTFPSGHTERFFDVEIIENGQTYVTEQHLTDFWTDKAVEFIESAAAEEAPFFLLLSYNGPYGLPPVVNADYENRYTDYYQANPPRLPQRPVGTNLKNWAQEGDPATYSERHGITPWSAIEALNNQRAMTNLAAETSMIDDGVGDVMAALERSGELDNTLVIYTSDQGASIGQRGLWGNSSWSWPFAAYEANSLVPLIVSDNGNLIRENKTADAIVNQYDVYPTILDILGQDAEVPRSPGKSFFSMLTGSGDAPESASAIFDYMTVRSIRTDRFRFIKRLLTGEVELYDRHQDAEELNNVASNPDYADIRAALENDMEEFFTEYADPKYDLWRGGAAKARMLDGGRLDQYRSLFPGWDKTELAHSEAYNYQAGIVSGK
ncbi:MAG: sulfatase [Henriciella sp.]